MNIKTGYGFTARSDTAGDGRRTQRAERYRGGGDLGGEQILWRWGWNTGQYQTDQKKGRLKPPANLRPDTGGCNLKREPGKEVFQIPVQGIWKRPCTATVVLTAEILNLLIMTVIKGVGVPVVDQIGHQAGNTAVLRQVCEKGADVVIGLAGVQNVMSDRKPKTAKLTVPLHDERKKMPKPVLIFHDNENKES